MTCLCDNPEFDSILTYCALDTCPSEQDAASVLEFAPSYCGNDSFSVSSALYSADVELFCAIAVAIDALF